MTSITYSMPMAALDIFSAAAVTFLLLQMLRPVAHRLGLLDHPLGRKDHEEPTASIGGFAMLIGILVTMACFGTWTPATVAFAISATLLIVVGMLDDKYDLPWWLRILAQCIAVLVMVYAGDLRVERVGGILGLQSIYLGLFSVPFTMFATVGVINAINMSDGVDGLAGGIVLSTFCMMDAAALYSGNMQLAQTLTIFAGAVAGFLLMNMRHPWQPRAKVFMGNAGSAMLGFAIAYAAFGLTQNQQHPVTAILPPWLVATPLIDCVCLMAHRLLRGQSPFNADRTHMHHIMLDAGFTPAQLTVTVVAINLLLGGLASVALYMKVPQPALVLVFIVLCLAYFWLTAERERAVSAFAALNRGLTLLRLKPKNELIQTGSSGSD